MKTFRLSLSFMLLFSAAIGLIGPAGCSSPGSCDTFAEDYCARIAACQPGIYAFLSGGDAAICRARLVPSCTQSVGLDGTKFSADTAGECGKSLRGTSCEDLLSGRLPDICNPAGTRADGASCSESLQCASKRCTGSATMCGSCVPQLKVGEPCQSSGQCQSSLYCKNAGTGTGTCTAYGQLGQACDGASPCQQTLFCNIGAQPTGTCTARRGAGEDCTRNTDCDDQKSLTCDPATKKCVTYTITYVDVGAACTNNNGTSIAYSVCKRDAHCVTSTGTGGGTTSACVAAAPAGQPCNTSFECVAGLTCTNKVCQVPPTPLTCP